VQEVEVVQFSHLEMQDRVVQEVEELEQQGLTLKVEMVQQILDQVVEHLQIQIPHQQLMAATEDQES
jgi:hypothetical protein